jgi:two-component system, NtrC family, C4-dicarboxylate transport sensor histidine kinase DctB
MAGRVVPNREFPPPERLSAINRLTVVARLLSSAVHDTRNALQIVTGHAELFAESTPNQEKARERSRAILTQADRATQRMHGLVVMAQDADAPPTRCELGALAEEVVGLRRSSFGRARIKVTLAPAAGEVWVMAPRPDLIRVVANLMLNAERAVTGRPGAEIVFSTSVVGGRARLTVQDNGPGVSEAVLPSLFEPFGPGTASGLGLHVSRWLMARAGGTLALASNQAGAAFALELPIAG